MKRTVLRQLRPMPASQVSNRRPIVVGHRGAAAVAPENTLPAFEAALNAGADGVEFDVQRTRDGHLVIFHDDDVDRTTDGNGLMADYSLAELKALDAGRWFDAGFAGTRIATLEEFFDWMRGNAMLMFLELKDPFRYPGIEQQVTDMIRAFDYVERVQVRSFFHAHLVELHMIEPGIAISELWDAHIPWPGEVVFNTVNVRGDLLTAEHIAALHEWDIAVTAWTVDDLALARQLKAWGIDGLTTNDPARILTLFKPGSDGE